MTHGVFERVGVQICRRQHAPASAVTASCIDGNPYVEHRDEIVIVVVRRFVGGFAIAIFFNLM